MTIAGEPAATEPKYYAVKRHLLEFIGSLDPGSRRADRARARDADGDLAHDRAPGADRARRRGAARAPPGLGHLRGRAQDHLAAVSGELHRAGRGQRLQAVGGDDRHPAQSPPRAELAQQLGLPPRAPVYRIERLRFADAFPIAVETSWLPAERFPGLTRQIRAHASLHAILGRRLRHEPAHRRGVDRDGARNPARGRAVGGRRRHADADRQPPELRLRRHPGRARAHLVPQRPRHARHAPGVPAPMTVADRIDAPAQLLGGGRVVTPDGVLSDAWVQVSDGAHRAGRRAPPRPGRAGRRPRRAPGCCPATSIFTSTAAAATASPTRCRRWSRRSPSTAATAPRRRSSRW